MKKAVIIGGLALAHFSFTFIFVIYLTLSFSIAEYQFLKPAFDVLYFPVTLILKTGILEGVGKDPRNWAMIMLLVMNSLAFGASVYLVIGLCRRLTKRRTHMDGGS